jgi:hypothetical protein
MAFVAAAAEPGFTVLFDGSSTAAWRGFRRDSFPAKAWVVENGALKTVVGGDRCDIITKDMYKDFELELSWRVSPGGNSGIFYDVAENESEGYYTGPEVQILDDGGHADGKNPKRGAGSLYDLIAPVGRELRPVGEYNQARVIKKGSHVEHWLNGKKVVEYELWKEPLTTMIAESKFKDMPRFAKERQGHIALQHHGQEIWIKDVRIRGAAIKADPPRPNVLTDTEARAGFRLLFDGKTTAGWRGFKKADFPSQGWSVRDGALVKTASGQGDSLGGGDIVTKERFSDFELRFDWRIAAAGNSGVKYLVTEERSGPIAHEYQLIDDDAHPDAKVGEQRKTAALYDALPATNKALRPVGEFNESRILLRGRHVEHWLNGRKVLEYELESEALMAAKAKSKFKDVAGWGTRLPGHILLQDHGDEVAFRNIRIRPLSPE